MQIKLISMMIIIITVIIMIIIIKHYQQTLLSKNILAKLPLPSCGFQTIPPKLLIT